MRSAIKYSNFRSDTGSESLKQLYMDQNNTSI